MTPTRILIADDHEIFRRGLRALLESAPQWQICGEAVDGVDAVEKVRELRPNIVVMDLSMPRLNGLEAAKIIRRDNHSVRIVIITQHDSQQVRAAAYSAGASAFVTKSSIGTELISALTTLINSPPGDLVKKLLVFRSDTSKPAPVI